MAILQSNSGTFNGTGDFSITLPTAPASGSLVVVEIAGNNVVGTPSGWTLRTSQVNYMGHYVWDRAGDGSTSSWTFNIATAGLENWAVHEIEGGAYSTASSQNDVGSGTSYTTPAITPAAADLVILASIGHTGAPAGSLSAWTNSFTEISDTTIASGDYPLQGVASLTVTANGSTAYSTGAAFSDSHVGRSAAIAAYSTGAPPPPSISLRAAGTATAAAAAVTAINPAVPTGATTGDLSVLTVWAKPFGTTITTPSGWTKIGEATNGTTAAGTDTGSTLVAVYVKESAAVGAIGNLTLGGSPNSVGAVINTYAKDPAKAWDFAQFTTGGDTTNAANYSATGAGGIAVAADDWVLASTAVNGDVGTQSATAIGGMSGASLGTTVVRQSADVTTGTDTHGEIADAPVTAGSSSAAPTLTYTNASSGSGTTLWLRLRQVPNIRRTVRVPVPGVAVSQSSRW